MNIICYGDSNTYGFNPLDGGRYETNWVDIVRAVSYTHLTLPTTPYV